MNNLVARISRSLFKTQSTPNRIESAKRNREGVKKVLSQQRDGNWPPLTKLFQYHRFAQSAFRRSAQGRTFTLPSAK